LRRNNSLCSICSEPYYSKNYCKIHYQRFLVHGDPLYIDPTRNRPAFCSVKGCDNIHNSRGYCKKHIRRFKKYGDPLITFKNMDHSSTCNIEECNNNFYGNDLCKFHYDIKYCERFGKIFDLSSFNYNAAIVGWAKLIKIRDNNECQVCRDTENIQSHHIFHKIKYPELSLNENNGITLCKDHHYESHGRGKFF